MAAHRQLGARGLQTLVRAGSNNNDFVNNVGEGAEFQEFYNLGQLMRRDLWSVLYRRAVSLYPVYFQ
jgi:hypothetical protein